MDEVVQVAANRAGRNKLRADFKIWNLGTRMRQQAKLQFMRQCKIALQALLLFSNLLVQTRVLDRNRDLGCERCEGALVIFGEVSAARVFEIEHADYFFLVDERHREFLSRLGIQQDVARIFADVRNQHRFFAFRRISYQPATDRDVVLEMKTFLKSQRETVAQFLAVGINQQHTEHLVIDDPAEQFSHSLQQFVQVQD